MMQLISFMHLHLKITCFAMKQWPDRSWISKLQLLALAAIQNKVRQSLRAHIITLLDYVC